MARANNGALFVQWTRQGNDVAGTLSKIYYDPDDLTKESSSALSFTGKIVGSSVQLQLSDGSVYTGVLKEKSAILGYTSTDGSVVTFDFDPANAAEYNSIVESIHSAVADARERQQAADEAERQQQQEAQNEVARAEASSRLIDLAAAVRSDLEAVVAPLDVPPWDEDLATARKDLQQTATDLAAARHAPADERCSAGSQVGSDSAQVGSDQAQIGSDDAELGSTFADRDSTVYTFKSDWQQYSDLAAQWPSEVPAGAPEQADIDAALARLDKLKAALEARQEQVDDLMQKMVDQADAYASAGGDLC